jgi:hypothetical protein
MNTLGLSCRVWAVLVIASGLMCSCGRRQPEQDLLHPLHAPVEAYRNNYPVGPFEGVRWGIPNPRPSNPPLRFGGTGGTHGGKMYTIQFEFRGTENNRDRYLAEVTVAGDKVYSELIRYDGTDTEVWRDEVCRVGLRPPLESN